MYYNSNMDTEIKIRLFNEKDRKDLENISWQVQEWEKQYYPGRALSKEIIAKHIERLIRSVDNSRGIILVAVADNSCIGYVTGVVHRDFLNTDDIFYVKDMGVDKKYRGKGIGTKLLQEIEKVAKNKYGLNKMIIAVICGNDGAAKLYKRMGYIPYELELIKSL